MRSNPTEAEAKCWALLRDRRLARFKFRRQLPFGNYIADFVCLEARLVIELDGSQHAGSPRDEMRDAYFLKQGFRVLRVWNNEILNNPHGVLDAICRLAVQSDPGDC
jgi:very-short-patch-repair endonuclease